MLLLSTWSIRSAFNSALDGASWCRAWIETAVVAAILLQEPEDSLFIFEKQLHACQGRIR